MKTFTFFLLTLSSIFTYAQVTWQKNYSSAPIAFGHSSLLTNDGNYLVFGRSSAATHILKLDVNGDTLWTKLCQPGTYNANIPSAIQLSDTNILFAAEGYSEITLTKMTLNGNHIWTKNINFNIPNPTYVTSVIESYDRNYIVGGIAVRSVYNFFLTKIDTSGDTLWTKMYWNNTGIATTSVIQTEDSGFFISGNRNSFPHATILLKVDSSGDTLYHKAFEGNYELFLKKGINGSYFFSGIKQHPLQPVGFMYNGFLSKLDSSGNVLWSRSYGDTLSNIKITDAVQNNDGSYTMIGYYSLRTGYAKVILLKVDSLGNMEWARIFGIGSTTNSYGNGIMYTADGGFLGIGKYNDDQNIYAFKTDALGLTGCMDSTIEVVQSTDTLQEIFYPIVYSRFPFFVSNDYWFETKGGTVTDICALLYSPVLYEKISISTFPNPTADVLTLETTNKILSVKIINPLGKVTHTNSSVNTEHLVIDCRSFPPGIYFLQAETENGMITTKFIKE